MFTVRAARVALTMCRSFEKLHSVVALLATTQMYFAIGDLCHEKQSEARLGPASKGLFSFFCFPRWAFLDVPPFTVGFVHLTV